MTYRLILRPEPEAELAEASDWYEQRVPGLGEEFLVALDAAPGSILSNPLQHPVLQSLHILFSWQGSLPHGKSKRRQPKETKKSEKAERAKAYGQSRCLLLVFRLFSFLSAISSWVAAEGRAGLHRGIRRAPTRGFPHQGLFLLGGMQSR